MERGISEIDYQVSIIFNVVHRPYHSYELGSTYNPCYDMCHLHYRLHYKNRDFLPPPGRGIYLFIVDDCITRNFFERIFFNFEKGQQDGLLLLLLIVVLGTTILMYTYPQKTVIPAFCHLPKHELI